MKDEHFLDTKTPMPALLACTEATRAGAENRMISVMDSEVQHQCLALYAAVAQQTLLRASLKPAAPHTAQLTASMVSTRE